MKLTTPYDMFNTVDTVCRTIEVGMTTALFDEAEKCIVVTLEPYMSMYQDHILILTAQRYVAEAGWRKVTFNKNKSKNVIFNFYL
jgi:hypothetical protein